jgi:DNA-binding PadR family transcriptional regulator
VALSNTANVILGFLSRSPMSGYELKQKIDDSTRFFFAASYGQIYPELKKLEQQGLVEGVAKSQGQRARTEYSITAAGREELGEWLLSAGNGIEMRDEALLKIFFSSDLPREQQVARIAAMRAERDKSLQRLREIDAAAGGEIPEMADLVLQYGLGLHQWVVDWCDRSLEELKQSSPTESSPRKE